MRIIIRVLFLSVSLICAPAAPGKSVQGSSAQSASTHTEAAQIATQRFGGKVLKVELESGNKKANYRVKLLGRDGTVRIVTVAASDKK